MKCSEITVHCTSKKHAVLICKKFSKGNLSETFHVSIVVAPLFSFVFRLQTRNRGLMVKAKNPSLNKEKDFI